MYVNLNKAWCRRFLRKFQESNKEEKISVNDSENSPENVGDKVFGTYYDILSEPESAEMELSLANTSKVWRNHTNKLLTDKIPL